MKKRLLSLGIAAGILASLPAAPDAYAQTLSDAPVGSIVSMGSYYGVPMQFKISGSRDVDGDGEEELMLSSARLLFCKELSADGRASWKTSSLRRWLSSNEEEVSYDSANVPSYAEQPGFLTHFSDNEKSVIVPETHKSLVAEALAHDGGSNTIGWTTGWPGVYTDAVGSRDINTAYYVMTTDYVFIPSIEDMYLYNIMPAGEYFSYDEDCLARAGETAAKERVWIRDGAAADTARFAWVNGKADISARAVGSAYGIRPCMYIKSGLNVTGDGTALSPYKILFPFDVKSVDLTVDNAPVAELADGEAEFSVSFEARGGETLDLYAVRYEMTDDGTVFVADMNRQSMVTVDGIQSAAVLMTLENTEKSYVKVFFIDENGRAKPGCTVFGSEARADAAAADGEGFSAQAGVDMKNVSVRGFEKNSPFAAVNIVVSKQSGDGTAVIYADCKNVSPSGGFAFDFLAEKSFFTEDTVGGIYTAKLYSSYAEEPVSVSVGIADEGLYARLITEISGYDVEKIKKILANDPEYMLEYSSMQGRGLYFEELANLNILDKTAAGIAAVDDGYTEESFPAAFNRLVSRAALEEAEDKYAVLENDRYSVLLGSKPYLNMTAYELLKAAGNERLFKNELLFTDFRQAVIITAAAAAENANALKSVVEENADAIGITFPGGYDKLSGTQQKKLYDAMLKADLSDYAKIKAAFDTAYADASKTTSGSGGGGGSSSSGGSSSGGGKSIAPAATVQIPTPKVSFSDVESLTWGRDEINTLAESGIIKGMTDSTFEPDGRITREQFCQMAATAFSVGSHGAAAGFSDTEPSAWYANAVAAMAEAGYISGIDANTFGVGKNITREDIAAILYRILGDRLSTGGAEFTDADEISEYARDAVGALAASGVISGYSDGSFGAKREVTRREAAVMIYRAMSLK